MFGVKLLTDLILDTDRKICFNIQRNMQGQPLEVQNQNAELPDHKIELPDHKRNKDNATTPSKGWRGKRKPESNVSRKYRIKE